MVHLPLTSHRTSQKGRSGWAWKSSHKRNQHLIAICLSPFSFCFLHLHLPPHFPFTDPHPPVEGLWGGGGYSGVLYTKAESASETAGSIPIYLFPPVVKMLSMAIQSLMAVFFHQRQGVTLESKSTSSQVLPGLSPD